MIKLFRHIRQQLIQENKMGKYFKYAIGEIILVVIGIIIALQINNWNEEKKQAANFDKILEALENQLIENIEEANFEINFSRKSIKYSYQIISNEVTRDDLIKNSYLRDIIRLNRLDINSDDINTLVNRQENFPEKYKILIPYLKNYLKIEDRYSLDALDFAKQVENYTDYIIKNETWPSKTFFKDIDSLTLKKEVDFYLDNPIYKNYLYMYTGEYEAMQRSFIGIRSACLVILGQIKTIREGFKTNEIKNLFKKYEILPYPEKTCEYFQTDDSDYYIVEAQFPFFNASKQTVKVQWKNKSNSILSRMELKPDELIMNPVTRRMKENTVIEVILNDVCIKKYQAIKNGFLLIE